MKTHLPLFAGFLAAIGCGAAGIDAWPEFRGPRGNGHARDSQLPLTWSTNQNVVWKTPIHDLGWSSPVIWGAQVWVTSATEDGKQLFAIALDRETGQIIHDIKVFDNERPEPVSSVNSYASPTPVIEADRIYAHYGTYGTACLDTRDGRVLWSRQDLNCDHHEGPGASPILHGNLVIFNVDGRDTQYVVALDKTTGQTVWKTSRSVDYTPYTPNQRKSFCTPIIIEVAGRAQLFSPGAKAMMGYDPRTGEELWKIQHPGWSIAPRPVYGHGLIFLNIDHLKPELYAVRPDGRGDVTATHVLWKVSKDMPAISSPLLVEDLIYVVSDQGYASCLEARTGAVVWRERLKGKYSASPIYASGRIYWFNEKGLATVLQPGRIFNILAENPLNDRLMATPAIASHALFIRTQRYLHCVTMPPR